MFRVVQPHRSHTRTRASGHARAILGRAHDYLNQHLSHRAPVVPRTLDLIFFFNFTSPEHRRLRRTRVIVVLGGTPSGLSLRDLPKSLDLLTHWVAIKKKLEKKIYLVN